MLWLLLALLPAAAAPASGAAAPADHPPGAATVSNHPNGHYAPNGPRMIGYAAGANALLADGSVRWMSQMDPSTPYHSTYYYAAYVDRDLRKDWN